MANPAADLEGDANGDGLNSSVDDEFIEIVNYGAESIDISDWIIMDYTMTRFKFPQGTILQSKEFALVFGGGDKDSFSINSSGGLIFTAESNGLGLNNDTDLISLINNRDKVIDYADYSLEDGAHESLTRKEDANP